MLVLTAAILNIAYECMFGNKGKNYVKYLAKHVCLCRKSLNMVVFVMSKLIIHPATNIFG